MDANKELPPHLNTQMQAALTLCVKIHCMIMIAPVVVTEANEELNIQTNKCFFIEVVAYFIPVTTE